MSEHFKSLVFLKDSCKGCHDEPKELKDHWEFEGQLLNWVSISQKYEVVQQFGCCWGYLFPIIQCCTDKKMLVIPTGDNKKKFRYFLPGSEKEARELLNVKLLCEKIGI